MSTAIETIGRRLRLALIVGGPGSVMGEVHRIAARLDGYYDIVASALSSDPQRSHISGQAMGVPTDRAYKSWQALIESEPKREDRADIVAVMTPNDSHYEICSAALDAGFHVLCDKPLTTDLATAVSLARKVRATGAEFCLTYCYTGYPMVRQAREMVRSDVIGPIRQIHLQYVQGWFTFDEVAAGWRLDPARIGASAMLVDIGAHAHHLGGHVSGLDLSSLCADVGHVVPGRKVVAAIGTLRGPLHGGANEAAMALIQKFNSREEARTAVLDMLARKEKIMGFGHAVYKNCDPRNAIIKGWSQRLSQSAPAGFSMRYLKRSNRSCGMKRIYLRTQISTALRPTISWVFRRRSLLRYL
jgi:predicted dehydrogenase